MDEIFNEISDYFDHKKLTQDNIIDFLENNDNSYYSISDIIKKEQYISNPNEFEHLLRLISNISNNHYRTTNFFEKIEEILQYLSEQIKQTFSNFEIFEIFNDNESILLLLFKNGILQPDESIVNELLEEGKLNEIRKCHFFLPEIKKAIPKEKMQKIEQIEKEIINFNPNNLSDYDQKRILGENDSYICSLIRNDSILEFIEYINISKISLSIKIEPSIFETNSFLKNKQPTMIEYAAFFGSIQIFQFLKMNGVVLSPSLLIYAVHSNNSEMIHMVEECQTSTEDYSYLKYIKESIKCHHNDIAKYFENNYLIQETENEKIDSYGFKYYNYLYIPKYYDRDYIFYYLCKYNYSEIVNILLEFKRKEIQEIIILTSSIFLSNLILNDSITFSF